MNDRNIRKEFVGTVISDRMDKTAIVLVETFYEHKLYKKRLKRRKKYYVHDEGNECIIGDKVRIMETRPLSKLKRWRLVEIVERAQ